MATDKNTNPNDPRNPLNRPEVPEEDKLQHIRENMDKFRGEVDHFETFYNERNEQHVVIGRKENNQTIIVGSSDEPIDLDALEREHRQR